MFCMFGHETFAFIAWVEIECWMTTMEPPIKRHQALRILTQEIDKTFFNYDIFGGEMEIAFQQKICWWKMTWIFWVVAEKSSVVSAGAFLPRLLSGRDFVDSTVGYAFLSSLCELSRSGTLEFLLQARRVQTWTCDPKENISMKVPIRNTFLPCAWHLSMRFPPKEVLRNLLERPRLEGAITLHFFLFH